ncbi:MAG TPA: TonB family protein [Blastocatellia bacterium]|nr:TonB family protein [Blastocatellia bacterium]
MAAVSKRQLLSRWLRTLVAGAPLAIVVLVTQNQRGTVGQVEVKPPAAQQHLFAELKSDDPAVRKAAANEFGSLRAKIGLRSLISTLSDKDSGVREAAAFALGQLTEPRATDALVKLMSDSNAEVRASAAFALGMLGERKGAQALSAALGDSDAAVRSSAVAGLGLIQNSESMNEIIEMLNDSSFDVRYDSVWALGHLGEPKAAPHLRSALISLDLIRFDDGSREAFRQTVETSIDGLRGGQETQGHPRRPIAASDVINRVNRPLAIRQTVRPALTERASRAGLTGSVGLRVLVGAEGRVVRAYVSRRLGYGLDQRAVEAALQYKFDPELASGMPQTTWYDLQVKF